MNLTDKTSLGIWSVLISILYCSTTLADNDLALESLVESRFALTPENVYGFDPIYGKPKRITGFSPCAHNCKLKDAIENEELRFDKLGRIVERESFVSGRTLTLIYEGSSGVPISYEISDGDEQKTGKFPPVGVSERFEIFQDLSNWTETENGYEITLKDTCPDCSCHDCPCALRVLRYDKNLRLVSDVERSYNKLESEELELISTRTSELIREGELISASIITFDRTDDRKPARTTKYSYSYELDRKNNWKNRTECIEVDNSKDCKTTWRKIKY